MKKILLIISTLFLLTGFSFSQKQFSIGLSGGIVNQPIDAKYFKTGIGSLISFFYYPSDNFCLSFSTGYMSFGAEGKKIDTYLVPLNFGLRYHFYRNAFNPYVCMEISRYYGRYNDEYYLGENLKLTTKRNISDFGGGIGLGFLLPLFNSIKFDFNSTVIGYETHKQFRLRTMVGLNYIF